MLLHQWVNNARYLAVGGWRATTGRGFGGWICMRSLWNKLVDLVKWKKPDNIPHHVAVIMDGNGRWAISRGFARTEGHRMGVKSLRQLVEAAGEIGIKYLSVYAFSTENWARPQEEVDFLMELLKEAMDEYLPELIENNVRVKVIGRKEGLDQSILDSFHNAETETVRNDGLYLNIAFNYGGRAELVDAVSSIVRKVMAGEITPEDIDEDLLSQHLYLQDQPPPDLLIRTGGEYRISNFLLWHIAYTELYVTKIQWPEFGRRELCQAVDAYSRRKRRFGQI
ncbi:MAG: isoprenyl transferase [Limnochordia bacterium]|jgi:undecaprenyl diphosphate synthase|nr:isoprenyl transferase [Limnochordia bacterium]